MSDAKSTPVARSGDPQTSWDAAHSIGEEELRPRQEAILFLFMEKGPMTDEELVEIYEYYDLPLQSVSGIRTRRSELVSQGKLWDSGQRQVLRSGRKAIVWTTDPPPNPPKSRKRYRCSKCGSMVTIDKFKKALKEKP